MIAATIPRIFTLALAPDASWTFEPFALLAAAIVTFVYVRRWRAVRASGARLASFLGGITVALLALVSPIDRLGEQLFFMHMIQHVMLLDIASILVLLGLTKVILRPVTKRLMGLEQAAGPLSHPIFALVFYVAVMWFWHVPALYDAALRHSGLHVIEHISFGAAGTLYWWHVLSPIRSRKRLGGLGPVAYMAVTKVLVGLLGVALAFSPRALYSFYTHQPHYWGLSAGTDQSVAGLVMALEQSIVMGIALTFVFIRALSESDREDERAERYETDVEPYDAEPV